MFPSASFAEWDFVARNNLGDTYYLDFERIRKRDGYVYFWRLSSYPEPTSLGNQSGLVYIQADCKLFRSKFLSDIYYTQPMGKGKENGGSNVPDEQWSYPLPNSVGEKILDIVCNQ